MRPGLIPPVPLEQARAASKAVADQTLTDEITTLRADNDRLRAELGRVIRARADLWVAAHRVDDFHQNGVGGDLWWAALDQLTYALTPEPDELAASMARHPAKGRRT